MKITLLLACCIATPAFAQSQPSQPEKEFNLKLTPADISTISDGLNEMPYKRVAPLMYKLQIQVNSQLTPVPETKSEESKPEEKKN